MNRNGRAHGLLGGAAILLIGVALGIVVDRTELVRGHSEAAPPQDQAEALATLTSELGLSVAQADAVREVLDRHQIEVTQAWDEVHLTLQTALDSVVNQIEAVLEPEQIERYHELVDARHPPGDRLRPSHTRN